MRLKARLIEWLALLVLLLTAALPAEAASVTIFDGSYTIGPGAGPQATNFSLAGAGTLDIKLTDVRWPVSLAAVSLHLVDTSGSLLTEMTDFGEATFAVAGPMTLFALSTGTPTPLPGLSYGFGTYGLDIVFTPAAPTVPLPQTALLLASGLAMLGMTRRRQRFAIKV